MGNTTLEAMPESGPTLAARQDETCVPYTPKLPLMMLKKGKAANNSVNVVRASSCFINSFENTQSGPAPRPGHSLHPTMTCVEIPLENAMRNTRISIKKLEKAQMDIPCEPDEEDDSFEKNIEDINLEIAPFAVRQNQLSLDNDAEYTPTKCSPKSEADHKRVTTGAGEAKVIVCKKFNNGVSEVNKKKALTTQKRLMEALCDAGRCNFCRKALPLDGNYMKAPCGHAFHYECVEDRPTCSECGEIIEKGFTI